MVVEFVSRSNTIGENRASDDAGAPFTAPAVSCGSGDWKILDRFSFK